MKTLLSLLFTVLLFSGGSDSMTGNQIVRFLLDAGKFDMNDLALMPFSDEDREQFAQLIGYSVCGFCDLSYVSEEAKDKAWEIQESMPKDEEITQRSLLGRCRIK